MSQTATATCLASNPDIAGIGVRAATYYQSLLLFATIFMFVFDGFVDTHEQKVLRRTYRGNLLLSCALLLSLVVQATTSELSVYHAIVVLNLCWVLIINALIICALPTIDSQIEPGWRVWFASFRPARAGQLQALVLVSIMLSASGAVGIWVWSNPSTFSASAKCAETAIIYVFLKPLHVSNRGLRIASLVLYVIAAIPVVNTTFFSAVAVIIVKMVNGLIPRPYTFGRLYRITAIIEAIMITLLIASTELTVHKNRGLMNDGSLGWGFGQILVLLLGIGSITAAIDVTARNISAIRWASLMARGDYLVRRILRRDDEPWAGIDRRTNQCLDSILAFFQSQEESPDSFDWTAITRSILSAKAYFALVMKSIQPPRGEEVDLSPFSSGVNMPRSSVEEVAAEVNRIHEMISAACDLRFPNLQSHLSCALTKAYLEAARDSLGAAKGALDAYCLAYRPRVSKERA